MSKFYICDTMKELKESHIKILKHFSNGLTHNLILWIISKESIHGYGIMKRLDLTDFHTEGMSEVGQILLIKHIENINLLIDKYNQFPSDKDLIDIQKLLPQNYIKRVDK